MLFQLPVLSYKPENTDHITKKKENAYPRCFQCNFMWLCNGFDHIDKCQSMPTFQNEYHANATYSYQHVNDIPVLLF